MIDEISMKIRADELIRMALAEDVTSEDVSTNSVLRAPAPGEAELICKQTGVIAGLPVFARVFELLGGVQTELLAADGDRVEKGQKLAAVRPHSVGQAARISGVSPADISVLLVYLQGRAGENH